MAAKEFAGSPTYAFDVSKGWSANRKWRMPWSESAEFLVARIGETLDPPGSQSGLMVGRTGKITPWENVAAEEAFNQDAMVYEFAVVAVSYGFPDTLVETDGSGKRFSIQFQPNMEVISLDYSKFQWGTDAAPFTSPKVPLTPAQAPFVKFFTLDIIETRYEVDITDAQFGGEIFSFIGLSNSSALIYKGVSFPKATLLYNAPTLTTTGSKWTVAYRYSYKLQTWNRFHKEDQPPESRFLSIWTTKETPTKYVFAPPTANFNLLPI